MRICHCLLFILTTLALAEVSAQDRPSPVMEYAALLSSVDITPGGVLQFNGSNDALTAAFLPKGAPLEATLTKAGSETPIHTQDFFVNHPSEVFARIHPGSKLKQFQFAEEGDYVLTFRTGEQVMTRLPFTVYRRANDDEFDPRIAWYTDGPWSKLAYAYSKLNDENATLEFRMWGKRVSFDGATVTDVYDVDLKKDGDVLAIGRTGYVGTQKWLKLQFRMQFPESKGGRMYPSKQLLSQDGRYHFVVRKNGQVHAVYELAVKDGKPVLHKRESGKYEPRSEYICPRYAAISDGAGGAGNTVWMDKLDAEAAGEIAEGKSAEVAGPDADQLKKWRWLPTSIDPGRPFHVVITDIETRSDTHIAAGEDIVVFGTGHPTGVRYLVAGESEAREIPNGEVYSSTLFHVCGKKIVLVRKNNLFIFDTESGTTTAIPASDITLYDSVGGLHRGNLLNADGYLVVAVNKATSVTDGNIIKVIDISGDTPVVIPIKNANYNDRQVSSVAVDAKNGFVAVSSAEAKLIAVAKVASLANQRTFDLTEYRGVDRRQIYLEKNLIVYADSDLKIRMLKGDAVAPIALTEEGLGSGNNGFVVRKGRLAVTTQEHVGTRYQMTVGDLPEKPMLVDGTGKPVEGTSGGLGMAGCAAIAIDKTVFIAGTPSGGIGVGEHLQMLHEETSAWVPLTNEQGQVISAIDVTTSIGFLAFKSGDRDRKTTIGYATYGERIVVPESRDRLADKTATPESTHATASLEFADDNPYNTHDEMAAAMLKSYLETEATVVEAYVPAFGEEEGRKKTIEAVLKAMTDNGQEDLIDEYKRHSKLVPDEDRPTGATGTDSAGASFDPAAVMSALNGQWQAIRFSAGGNDLPDDAIENLQLTFADGKYVMTMSGELQTGTYEIDTESAPMAMSISIGTGDNQGQKRMGSFKLLKDNRLLIVFATSEEGHPVRFVPDESGATIMAVYEKQK